VTRPLFTANVSLLTRKRHHRAAAEPLANGVDVVVVHETNGPKYFEALAELQRRGTIRSLSFFEASVLWKFGHSIVRERRSVIAAAGQAWRNFRFRVSSGRLRGKVIVIGLAPWDFRFLLYARLRRHNHVIYHTSWAHWSAYRVPRPGGTIRGYLRRRWLEILKERGVDLIAVTDAASDGLSRVVGKTPAVIPHVVADVFFGQRASYGKPFRLLFVGELVENRGLKVLADVLTLLKGEPVLLEIVGDGPQHDYTSTLVAATGGRWHHHIADRAELSRVMASCQLMVSAALKTPRWEELFGMAIVEAMACGLPCIASNHVGPRSIIENGVSGILLPDNAAGEIAQWVRHFLRDEKSWTLMSGNARKRAETFRLGAIVDKWRPHLTP
jgi:glycosyltransferase involved in cell wall biosynthesis